MGRFQSFMTARRIIDGLRGHAVAAQGCSDEASGSDFEVLDGGLAPVIAAANAARFWSRPSLGLSEIPCRSPLEIKAASQSGLF